MKTKIWDAELQAEIRRCFRYIEETGAVHQIASFSHKGPQPKQMRSKTSRDGYLITRVTFNGKRRTLRIHRIAFFLKTGLQPDFIDHRNGVRSDNRWDNLREASSSQNGQNRHAKSGSSPDLPVGVTRWKNKSGLWYRGYVRLNGKSRSKDFRSVELAIAWREKEAAAMFGEFAPT